MNHSIIFTTQFLKDATAAWMIMTMPMMSFLGFVERLDKRFTRILYILFGIPHLLFSLYLSITIGIFKEITPSILTLCWTVCYFYYANYNEMHHQFAESD